MAEKLILAESEKSTGQKAKRDKFGSGFIVCCSKWKTSKEIYSLQPSNITENSSIGSVAICFCLFVNQSDFLFFKQLNFPEGFQAAQQNKNNLKDVFKDYSSRQLSTFQMTSGSFS